MISYTASFTSSDECDHAIAELKRTMKVSHMTATRFNRTTSGDLPINYPYSPISHIEYADWLTGREHILTGSNVNINLSQETEHSDRTTTKLRFICADKNRYKAENILLRFKAYDISAK